MDQNRQTKIMTAEVNKGGYRFSLVEVVPSIQYDPNYSDYLIRMAKSVLPSPIYLVSTENGITCYVQESNHLIPGNILKILMGLYLPELDWKLIDLL